MAAKVKSKNYTFNRETYRRLSDEYNFELQVKNV